MSSRSALRALLAADSVGVAVECHSALTARLAESAGFEAVYVGGSALSNYFFAMPDHGLITTTELTRFAAEITPHVDIPLIVDGDQGGETAMNVRRFVRDLESVGVAGVHLEDTANPKHMYENDTLVSVDLMRRRIGTAVESRRDGDLVVIARTDELFNKGSVDEAIRRGIAYAEEGADAYFCLSMTPEQIEEIRKEVPVPLVDINQPREVAERRGLRLDIFTGALLPVLTTAYRRLLAEIKERGEVDMAELAHEYSRVRPLLDDDSWMPVGRRWVRTQDGGRDA